MDVYLVRHGETPLNAARILQFPDTPLSEHGSAQAERVGRRLATAGINRVLTSDYARARATADAIHAATGAPVELEPLLRERNFCGPAGVAAAGVKGGLTRGFGPPDGHVPANSVTRLIPAMSWATIRGRRLRRSRTAGAPRCRHATGG